MANELFNEDELDINPASCERTVTVLDVHGRQVQIPIFSKPMLDRNFQAIIRDLRNIRNAIGDGTSDSPDGLDELNDRITDLETLIATLENSNVVLGKTDSSVNKGSSVTVSIWAGTFGSEADTGVNVTGVGNRWVNIGSGKWVLVAWNGTQPYIAAVECPPT